MKIICIGRNYADHAKEMNSPVPKEPIFFMKPDTALLRESEFYLPDFTKDLQHEVELVIKINKVGKNIAPEFASGYYNEIGLGIDFTARDIQKHCKENGLPWEKAKAFDNSAIISASFIPKASLDLSNIEFSLTNNNTLVQKGNSKNMLFSFDQLISHISKYITLKVGDLIYTGTPEGVASVKIGDKLQGFIGNQSLFEVKIL
ncbi:MAG: fumarylacetoacetate hydrolase family protein [Crocinitomicaceae bacterium]|nr:fumarylacetoacetate hydrolase family protein [Crocinitomicaceae bacterium]